MESLLVLRINQRLAALKKSAAAASLDAGMGRDVIRDLQRTKRGKIMSPTLETIEKLAKSLQTAPAWLAFGVGSEDRGTYQSLPVLGRVAAGVWRDADADEEHSFAPSSLVPDLRYPVGAQFLVEAVGRSMDRVIQSGELIHCVSTRDTGLAARPNDIVIAERIKPDGSREVSAKRYLVRRGKVLLAADSTDEKFKDFVLSLGETDGEEVTVTAIALRVVRELRT